MAKTKKRGGFFWGVILGILVAAGAVYYYTNHMDKSDTRKIKRETRKIEKEAKKEIEKAGDEVKKLFDKKD